MARVTVEDCVLRVPNRFELVMLAAQRGRNLGAGTALTVERDNDKNPVVALREIAEGTVELKELENSLIRGLQKVVEADEPESDELDSLTIDAQLSLAAETADPAEEPIEDGMHVEGEGEDEIEEPAEDDTDEELR